MRTPTKETWDAATRAWERKRAPGGVPVPPVTAAQRPVQRPAIPAAPPTPRPVQQLVTRQPTRRAPTFVRPAEAPSEPAPATSAEKRLREAAKAVLDAWEGGDLADAVRCLDVVVNGGTGQIGRAALRNLYHPSSYRQWYEMTLSGEDLMKLQLLTNAASIAGPVGTTAYLINPKAMAWAKERLRKIRESK